MIPHQRYITLHFFAVGSYDLYSASQYAVNIKDTSDAGLIDCPAAISRINGSGQI